MKGLIAILMCFILLGCASQENIVEQPEQNQAPQEDGKMKITTDAFENNGMIPAKYTCQGDDINPKLMISDVPSEAKSLALIFDDPDAPMGTWVHWLVKDIPVDVKVIEGDSMPGVEVDNDFGKGSYGGPCPPSGIHRYFFRLYALDVESFEAFGKEEFYSRVKEHKIEEAVLMGKYSKG